MPSNAVEDIDVDELFARMAAKDRKANDGNETDSGLDATGDMETEPEDTTVEDTPDVALDGTDDIHEDLQADLTADDPEGGASMSPMTPTAAPDPDVTDAQAQHAALDALASVLPELREHLTRTVAWVDEALASIEVSRDR